MKTLCVLLLALGGLVAVLAAPLPDCTGAEVFVCSQLVKKNQIPEQWPENEEDLETSCKNVQPALKCMSEIPDKCTPPSSLGDLLDLYKDQYELTKRACSEDGDLRKNYLKNAKCINAQHKHIDETCGHVQVFGKKEELTKEQCREDKKIIACHSKEAEEHCGADAGHLAKEVLKPDLNFLDKVC